jgi:hypothetical protein
MKTLIILIITFVLQSCKNESNEIELEKLNIESNILFNELCISNKSNYSTPEKWEDLKEVEGVIFEKKGIPNSIFYIKANNNLYSSCKLTNELKKDGLKIVFSGTSYKLSYICKAGEACPSFEGIPLITSHIKSK